MGSRIQSPRMLLSHRSACARPNGEGELSQNIHLRGSRCPRSSFAPFHTNLHGWVHLLNGPRITQHLRSQQRHSPFTARHRFLVIPPSPTKVQRPCQGSQRKDTGKLRGGSTRSYFESSFLFVFRRRIGKYSRHPLNIQVSGP